MTKMTMTDKEVAALLDVSPATISRMMRERQSCGGLDLRKAKPWKIGKTRRWDIGRLAKALGVAKERVEEKMK